MSEEEKIEGEVEVKKKKKKRGDMDKRVHVERVFTIPLRNLSPRWRRGEKAMFAVRDYLVRHMKTQPDLVHLDASINEKIFERGAKKPPRKIRVRAMKFEDGVVEAESKE